MVFSKYQQLIALRKNKRISKGKKGGKKKVYVLSPFFFFVVGLRIVFRTDPFLRKEWYDVKAPVIFQNRNVCKTVVNRTAGQSTISSLLLASYLFLCYKTQNCMLFEGIGFASVRLFHTRRDQLLMDIHDNQMHFLFFSRYAEIASEALKGRVFEASLADLQKDEELAYRKIRLRVEEVQGRNCLTSFHGMDLTTDKVRILCCVCCFCCCLFVVVFERVMRLVCSAEDCMRCSTRMLIFVSSALLCASGRLLSRLILM